jgi:hypothetical protein
MKYDDTLKSRSTGPNLPKMRIVLWKMLVFKRNSNTTGHTIPDMGRARKVISKIVNKIDNRQITFKETQFELQWNFDPPLTEERRVKLQEQFVEALGSRMAAEIDWSGVAQNIKIASARGFHQR